MEQAQAQQIEPLLPKNTLWQDQYEEYDEEEVNVGLIARHSRYPINGVGVSSSSFSSTTTTDELQPVPVSAPASPPINGTSSKRSDQEEENEIQEPTAGNENEKDKLVKVENDGNGNSVYFDKPQGTRSVNGTSDMHSEISKVSCVEISHQQVKNVEDQQLFGSSPTPVEQLLDETSTTPKHFETTRAESNVDLIGEVEEDLMELDVERVLEKQNTHDLYCPKCNSCITQKVILVRRKPKISNVRQKPKRAKKLGPFSDSGGNVLKGDKPETSLNAGPASAADEQINSTEQTQEQEAFSCLSCFSLFIPIGHGCFKIFRFFRQGRQNENTQSSDEISQRGNTQTPQDVRQRENAQSPQQLNLSENAQSPQDINWKETTPTPQGIIQNENTETSLKVIHTEDIQSPPKRSSEENVHSPQYINNNEEAEIPQYISSNENTPSPQNLNQKESNHIPQNVPTFKKNFIFSIFAFNKGKATVEKAAHAPLVQSSDVSIQSVTNVDYIDGAAIKTKEPGISNILSSTNNSVLDKVKAESWERKLDAHILPRNTVSNEIQDLEAGLIDQTSSLRTEVGPWTQSGTQNNSVSADAGEAHEWEILKSIIYGGLVESITSLGVVSSAAGAGAATLNILALGLANLIGGLVIIIHNLIELKNDKPRGASGETNVEDRYQTLLGRRQNFALHLTVAILSFLIFGLVPPVAYGFSFGKGNDKDLKLAAVAGSSLICIILLALGKGHIKKPHRAYFRTVAYYVGLGIAASGLSYVVGELLKELIDRLGLFESSSALSMPFLETIPSGVGRTSF